MEIASGLVLPTEQAPMATEQAPFVFPEPPHFPENPVFFNAPENIQVCSHSLFPISLLIIHNLEFNQFS